MSEEPIIVTSQATLAALTEPDEPRPWAESHSLYVRVPADVEQPEVGAIFNCPDPLCGAGPFRITTVRPHPNGGWWCDLQPVEAEAGAR